MCRNNDHFCVLKMSGQIKLILLCMIDHFKDDNILSSCALKIIPAKYAPICQSSEVYFYF
ncbi:hypothetical protein WH47_07591 [Habropoda laboriosa]|uniref:Uncharacterized protein n=1 Tax=Habropoda laboriosa TaxID=597456 RepID=A0A0L7RE93_9HYME|nr:hypothetical protein WH47_07591 [Habropoda laboriosa]